MPNDFNRSSNFPVTRELGLEPDLDDPDDYPFDPEDLYEEAHDPYCWCYDCQLPYLYSNEPDDCPHGSIYGECIECHLDDHYAERDALAEDLKHRPVNWDLQPLWIEQTRTSLDLTEQDDDTLQTPGSSGLFACPDPFGRERAEHERSKRRAAARRDQAIAHHRRAVPIARNFIFQETQPDHKDHDRREWLTDRSDRLDSLKYKPWQARFLLGRQDRFWAEKKSRQKKLIRKAPLFSGF